MKMKFNVGDRVRVSTKRFGRDQLGDRGYISSISKGVMLPITVAFDVGSHAEQNAYDQKDLTLITPKVALKPHNNRTVDPRGSQTDLLLAHLGSKGSITQVEASALFKIRSLTRRIADLRGNGFDIRSETKWDAVNRQRYVRYYMEGVAA